jgi:hypothetical protein
VESPGDGLAEAGLDEVSSWRRPGPAAAAAARLRQAEPPLAPEAIVAPEAPVVPESEDLTQAPAAVRSREAVAPEAFEPEPASEPAPVVSAWPETPRPTPEEAKPRGASRPDSPAWPEQEPILPREEIFGPRYSPGPDPDAVAARPAAPSDPASEPPLPPTVGSTPEPAGKAAPAAPAQAPRTAPVSASTDASGPDPSAARPKTRKGVLDKDGVRDIWARLQAMDDGPKSRRKAEKSDAEPETESDTAASPTTDPIPWERLDIYGFLPGLGLTLRQILLSPGAFFGAMPEGRPKGKALVFNLFISEFLLVIDFLWSLFGLRAKWAGPGNADLVGAVTTSPGLGFLLALLLVPPFLTIGVYLDAWITHLLLRLFRSAKKGFPETFRVLCYSAAPTALSAVPVAGQLLSPVILVWYMAIQAIGLTKVHKGALTQTLAAVFIKWSLYLFLLLAMLQSISPGH